MRLSYTGIHFTLDIMKTFKTFPVQSDAITPYLAMCCFGEDTDGTLKIMLKRMCAELPEWDQYALLGEKFRRPSSRISVFELI